MFSGMPNPLQTASTLCDSGEHHHVQTGSTNNLETETDIDAMSRVCALQVWLRSNRRHATLENSVMCKLPAWGTVSTSGLYLMLFSVVGHCRHRWKCALKHSHSRWDHLDIVFRRKVITTSGISPPSWNFWVKEASGYVGIYTSKKLAPIV